MSDRVTSKIKFIKSFLHPHSKCSKLFTLYVCIGVNYEKKRLCLYRRA